ncbi:MAG: 2-oxoacid:ferredoxin oxidoreductase subunit beta [Candidatus Cloacimonadota bacterium]|nr:MAG: 2-oxoacid:ferredoxin oxidoreductase subunit beta [Candidatus Cloacimonadota bacterium]
MAKIPQKRIHKYLRHKKKFPHVWCPGCSNGIVLGTIIRAIDELKIERDDIAMVSGIGCSSRMPVYVDFNTLHTLHGRAIAYATGIKMFKPHMKVIVVTGDGDSTAIGGNHFIHAARRNIDLTVVVINNNIYGMTGGQYSPTTPTGDKATTTPFGNIDPVFDICRLAEGAGASFVARTTAYHAIETQNIIKKALNHEGFSMVEVVSACPVIYGRLNKKGGAPQMMDAMKNNALTKAAMDKLDEKDRQGKYLRGIFREEKRPEYTAQYAKVIESLRGGK